MIVDTGVIYADIDRSDDWHVSATELLSTAPGPLRVPFLVVTEVCYLLETRLGPAAEADFLAALSRHDFVVIPLTSSDYARAAELVRKYADLPLGGVDASVIAVAERLAMLMSRPPTGGTFMLCGKLAASRFTPPCSSRLAGGRPRRSGKHLTCGSPSACTA